MFAAHKICDTLTPSEYCFVVECYNAGKFDRLVHKHLPRHRISRDDVVETLRTLVARFDGGMGMGAEEILSSRLNNRLGGPAKSSKLAITIDYNEAGALRTYRGGNTVAWFDVVTQHSAFRAPESQ